MQAKSKLKQDEVLHVKKSEKQVKSHKNEFESEVPSEQKDMSAELNIMFAGEENDDEKAYDMRSLVKAEKDRLNPKKKYHYLYF